LSLAVGPSDSSVMISSRLPPERTSRLRRAAQIVMGVMDLHRLGGARRLTSEAAHFPTIRDRLRTESQRDATPTHELERTNGFNSPFPVRVTYQPTAPDTRAIPAVGQKRDLLEVCSTRGCVRRLQYHRWADPFAAAGRGKLTLRDIGASLY
jgi:hypothetical protein